MVSQRALLEIMNLSIDFDGKRCGLTKEIEDEGPEWMLSPKYQASGP